ncbi:MAG: FecR domain-containing protein [Usitatibacteraceae bacterium]
MGGTVSEGQQVETGDNGFVTLKLADGSTLVVQSKSKVKLETARTISKTDGIPVTQIKLESGRVEAQVEKQKRAGAGRFEISTPTSNMGVRGTKFRVSSEADAKSSRGEVLEGVVNVAGASAASALDLNAGFGTLVEQNKPPLPAIRLLAAPDLSATPKLQERPVLRFKFAESAGAAGYRAQVAADSAYNDMRAEGVFKTAEAKFADLADGQYFLRVRAIDAQGIEGSDASVAFRLKARPEPPFTSAPPNKDKFSGMQAEFVWASASEAASGARGRKIIQGLQVRAERKTRSRRLLLARGEHSCRWRQWPVWRRAIVRSQTCSRRTEPAERRRRTHWFLLGG